MGDGRGHPKGSAQRGDFAHTIDLAIYLEAITPADRWQRGCSPNVSLHRASIDAAWAFTWTDWHGAAYVPGS